MTIEACASAETRIHELQEPVVLECGEQLTDVRVAYRTWGQLAGDGGNAVVVCHALTGSADVDRWWAPMLGPGRALDPERDFVVCSNVLGGCCGTTGPASLHPGSSHPWGPEFPPVTIRDIVRVQGVLLDALGVRRIRLVLGGSMGGMQVLEWALMDRERVEAIAPVSVGGRHSAWCIGISEAQRLAIGADPLWQGGRYDPAHPPGTGLATARAIAMVSYRSRASFERRFGRALREPGRFEVQGYLQHQGRKLVERFDANAYVTLTRAMDTHDVARGRGAYEDVVRSIEQPALVVASASDVLYPPEEQAELARIMPHAELAMLQSDNGHDAFLTDADRLNELVTAFRSRLTITPAGESPHRRHHLQALRPEARMTARKVTTATLTALKARGEKAVFVTAYDFPTATFADRAGADMLLVGDSAAMTMLGLPTTLGIGMEEMLVFARAVARAARRALVIGDLPFLSYQPTDECAVRNAGAFVAAGCDAVKCEGGRRVAHRVRAMCDAGIAVMGHLGLTPQSLGPMGGYRVQGRSLAAAQRILDDALALEDAGIFALLLEAVPSETAAFVRERLRIPVYGIGAGPDVDGQLVISHDLLGSFVGTIAPRFVRRYATLGDDIERAFRAYAEDVRAGRFPAPEHCYDIDPAEEAEIHRARVGSGQAVDEGMAS